MLYAILSDIHSNLEALTSVLDYCKKQSITKYICLGDIVGYNASPSECIELIRNLNCSIVVRGNHDEYIGNDSTTENFNTVAKSVVIWSREQLSKEQRKWLSELKLKSVDLRHSLTAVHSTLDTPEEWNYIYDSLHANENFIHQMTQICFYGHSHVPKLFSKKNNSASENEVVKNTQWEQISCGESSVTISLLKTNRYLINAGSIGQPRNGDFRASFSIYDSNEKTITRVALHYDIENAQRRILKAGLPMSLAVRLGR